MTLCRHCFEPLDAHVDSHPPGSPVPNARCCGIKRYFEPEAIAPPLSADDLERIERERDTDAEELADTDRPPPETAA